MIIPPQIRLYRQKNKTNEQPEEWIVSVSKDNEKKQVQIELLVTDTGKGLITQAASTTTKKIPNDLYNFKDVTTKDQKDLLLNELIAGNGPDMLYVSRSDFIALAEKGLLLDVSTLLSKDTLNRLLPAALELGTYNDKLLGMPVCVKGSTILISSETWNQHKWNIDDMLRLMREHKLDGSLYYGNAQTCFAPMATFRMLIRNFLREPWLIDWEKGQCYFNGERFIEFLSLLKDAERDNDTEMWLANGKRIAYFDIAHKDFIYDFGYKEEIENGHYVGFPTAGDGGNYLDADGLLVVCKNTEKLDAIKDLLTGVLDDTIQKGADISVNKISLPETEISEEGKQNIGGHEIMILKSGKSSILVAKEFLESCVAAPLHENELENIIMEEVDPYFQGRKTAQEIAEIIQNRVQLYLDEK